MKQDNQGPQTKYIVLAFVAMSLIIVGIIALFYTVNKPGVSDPNDPGKVDPDSGEIVSNPKDKSPESYGVNPDAPIYLGFSVLYTSGLSQNQVESIKSGLGGYADSIKDKTKISQISLRKNSITHIVDSNAGTDVYKFTVVMNSKDEYIVEASKDTIDTISFTLFKDNKSIYKSLPDNG